ncbi:MAG: glycosyltransferase, partial [Bacteroidetes bacterium]
MQYPVYIAAGIALLTLAYAGLILWYRYLWQRLPAPAAPQVSQPASTSITVIVPARNEAANIAACLQSVLGQQYPMALLQLIVVNDASTDDTAEIVAGFMPRHPNLLCISLPATVQSAHKKRAIQAGIAAATGNLVVCTDADCTMRPQWLQALASAHQQGAQFVAAPVMFHTRPTLLSIFQTLDFISLQGITGASVSGGFHTMCNGANIAYTKAAFHQVNGFSGIDLQPTGDDMLLMYKIYRAYPQGLVWLKSTTATVTTAAAHNWYAFFQQRIRWASKAAFYQDRRVF